VFDDQLASWLRCVSDAREQRIAMQDKKGGGDPWVKIWNHWTLFRNTRVTVAILVGQLYKHCKTTWLTGNYSLIKMTHYCPGIQNTGQLIIIGAWPCSLTHS
jgi:hypothetical protein